MTTHKNPTTTAVARQRDVRLAWRALALAAASENFGSARWWIRRLHDLAAPAPTPKPESRRELVFLDRDVECCCCGRTVYAGTEAQRVLGTSLAHVACSENGMGGPHGT